MSPTDPETIVQRQVDAYNAHDIEAFMATYSLGILFLNFPLGMILTVGHKDLRLNYTDFLQQDKPHVNITARIVRGNTVIDHESGTATGHPDWEAATIYEVINGLIQRVWVVQA